MIFSATAAMFDRSKTLCDTRSVLEERLNGEVHCGIRDPAWISHELYD